MLCTLCEDELASANADASLGAAVDAARSEGFTFAAAEELFPLSRRLGALLRAAPLDELLELLERVVPLAESATRKALVDPLTDRELTVLRYLTSRLTTREVALELYVSAN